MHSARASRDHRLVRIFGTFLWRFHRGCVVEVGTRVCGGEGRLGGYRAAIVTVEVVALDWG